MPESAALRAVRDARLLLDAMPRAVVIADLDGTVLAWNSAAERAYGIGRTTARTSITDFFSESAASDIERVIELVHEGEAWSGAVPVVVGDVTEWVHAWVAPLRDSDGKVVGVMGAADDAQSEIEVLQRRAADLSEHLVLALAAGELGTWRWTAATGATDWDPTMERLFGLEPGTFDGTYGHWASLLHPDDAEETLATVDRAVANKSAYQVEHRVIWPDGTVHWLLGRGTVTLDADSNVIGTIGCTSDITPRKRLEIETSRRVDQAEEAVERERQLRQRLEFLAEINTLATSANSHRELMRSVTSAAVPELGDWCTLYFLPEPGMAPEVELAHVDPAKAEWAVSVRQQVPWDPDQARGVPAVIRTGRLEFLREVNREVIDETLTEVGVDDEGRERVQRLLADLGISSAITVPLNTSRRTIGAMQIVSAESGRVYDHEDVALAQAAAGRIAEALDNVWLNAQHRSIARKLQASLLPPRLPVVEGLTLAARYWPAGAVTEVGGDFYDAFAISDRDWAVVIGDVCGTGPDAAAVTAIARHTIRAAATHGADPTTVLSWLNDALHAGNRNMFATVAYLTLEPTEGGWAVVSTSAGHPFPLIVRADGVTEPLGTPGMLVGAVPDITVTPVTGFLRSGDSLVLYTDGVTDVAPPHGLDPEQLQAMVSQATDDQRTAEDIAAAIGQAIEEVLPISERNDDVALLVVHVS